MLFAITRIERWMQLCLPLWRQVACIQISRHETRILSCGGLRTVQSQRCVSHSYRWKGSSAVERATSGCMARKCDGRLSQIRHAASSVPRGFPRAQGSVEASGCCRFIRGRMDIRRRREETRRVIVQTSCLNQASGLLARGRPKEAVSPR